MGLTVVAGATGTVGARLVARLTARGHRVRAVSRNPSSNGVESVAADLADPDQAVGALGGATAVYITPPLGGDDPLRLEREVVGNLIDAAKENRVGHVVMHTALHADRGNTGAGILDNKTALEEALAGSGTPYTIIRPAWFLQNLWGAKDYLERGVVSFPWGGDMVWAATDVEDVVTAAVGLFEAGPQNAAFDLHIPGGITGNQVAQATATVLGRHVAYQEAPVTTREYVEAFPISDVHKDLYAELFDYFRSTTYLGEPQAVTGRVAGLTYRRPKDFLAGELFAA